MALAPGLTAPAIDEADTGRDFATQMALFAPFEPLPHLAVAVSGGSDSMALTLLADGWARVRGGRITALTVDHGLRPDAAAEAAQVAAWCAKRGIDHVVLSWTGSAPRRGLQAAARAARYALLEAWCRDHHVLHLLLAHQREDQAETVAIRDASGSGIDGLAGMAGLAERGAVRILRPVLGVSRARLRDFLVARDHRWIDDPSNRNAAFTRVRVRNALAVAAAGSSVAFLGATAARLGRARQAREVEDAHELARWVMLDPAGFAWLDPQGFDGPKALGVRALGAILAAIAGSEHPPRRARLERLQSELAAGLAAGRTLGGCMILPRRGKILICREPAAVAPPVPVVAGARLRWDGRFHITLARVAEAGLWLGALGGDAAAIARLARGTRVGVLPAIVRATLPALRDAKGVVAVPSLGYFERREEAVTAACRVQFRPNRSLTGAGFIIV